MLATSNDMTLYSLTVSGVNKVDMSSTFITKRVELQNRVLEATNDA